MAGFVALLVVLVAALYVCWLMLQPFLNVLLWATVLTVVFYPMHRRIVARLHGRSSAAAASTVLVIVLILLPVTSLTVAVVRELSGVATRLNSAPNLLSDSSPAMHWLFSHVDQYVHVDRAAAQQFISSRMQAWGAMLASSTLVVVGGVVGAIVQTGLVVFTMFYLFRDGDRLGYALSEMLPLERVQTSEIAARTRDVIGATVYGVMVIALIQGTLGTIIFWALGLPSPLLWGVVMFFLSMIPFAGSFLVWAPAAVYLALAGSFVRAAVLVGWGMMVIGTIDNFLSPRLVGKRARLHPLLIFFAVLGGLQLFGVLGLVLGPVVVAITLALVEMVRQAHRPPSGTSTEPAVRQEQGSSGRER